MQKEEMQEKKQIVIWPVYLDAGKARNEGRLAPAECSVKAPKASEIYRAAEKLGLHPELVKDKAHPAAWTDRSGMVVVDNRGPKSEIIRKIGAEIIRIRGGRQ
ncbi:MAG: Signal recognition particle 19 kDa protein [Methanocella sp. PtaU1.Bin125]|nr:MAG: Signal recognition particle 19 kDa protein [Methanocella sp. PtaU1.Bin125]